MNTALMAPPYLQHL